MAGQVNGEASHRVRVTPVGGEDHPAGVEVSEDADVVLAFARGGLIHPDPAHAGGVELVAGGVDVVFGDPPDPGVVLAGHRGDFGDRHRRREATTSSTSVDLAQQVLGAGWPANRSASQAIEGSSLVVSPAT